MKKLYPYSVLLRFQEEFSPKQLQTRILNIKTMKLQFLHTCIVLALHIETRTAAALVHCGPGEKLVLAHGQKPDVCVPCPSRQYQNKKHHRLLYCLQCAAFDSLNPRLVLADECTRFHNTKFRCKTGFYLEEGDCYPCTNCALLGKFKGRACSKKHDTICCDFQGMVVENGICKFDLIYCGAGEYLVPGMSRHRDECRPCGSGSNNPEHRHRNTNCSVIHTTGKSGSTGSSEMVAMPMIISLLLAVTTVYYCYKRRSLVIHVY
ncbi:hypothetical protein RRG08_043649 [Elysia crispata]|uniref:TNFR-Cys domain-containing protein n=1 Tax=Elysia crispata TaxID=231223 RepID=A0AAE1DMD8_9GAST|nr:hypothetical protein RRG08_043649 [Elysia crispata]